MSLYYKFVAVPQEGFLSSSPRRLNIRFFSKALVGEHRIMTFLYHGHDLDSAAAPDVSFAPSLHRSILIIQTFSNLKHALLYESHCPYSRGGIYCFLCSRYSFLISVSTEEICLLTLKALCDNWIVTRMLNSVGNGPWKYSANRNVMWNGSNQRPSANVNSPADANSPARANSPSANPPSKAWSGWANREDIPERTSWLQSPHSSPP